MRNYNITYILLIILLLVVVSDTGLWAQCSVCTQTTDGLEENAAKGLNMGIIYLAMLPITIIGVITYIFFKKSK